MSQALAMNDTIDRLPPEAQIRFDDLRDRTERAFAVQRDEARRADEARKEFQIAADRLQRLEDAYAKGHVLRRRRERIPRGDGLDDLELHPRTREVVERIRVAPDDKLMEAERSKVARLEAEWRKRQAAVEKNRTEASDLAALRQNIDGYVANDLLVGLDIPLYSGKSTKLAKGNPADNLETVRTQRVALREEQLDVLAAPFPPDEIKEQLNRQIDRLARSGAPLIDNVMTLGALEMPTTEALLHTVLSNGETGVVRGDVPDAIGVIAWLFQNDLKARLEAEVDRLAEPDLALASDEREKRLADLARRMLTVEREEAAILGSAAADGITLMPRPDHDARAYLGLADDLPTPSYVGGT